MSDPRVGLVIEDDQDIRELVRTVLTQAGFDVTVAGSGAEGVLAAKTLNPDVITLDLGLPDIDGFEVSRQIREFSDAYIVMLTARTDELDTLIGLESGADDYLTKPFRPRELRARVAAMMRRPRAAAEPADAAGATEAVNGAEPAANGRGNYTHNGLDLSYASRSVTVDGAELNLTRTEFELLYALLEAGRTVRTKSDLVRHCATRITTSAVTSARPTNVPWKSTWETCGRSWAIRRSGRAGSRRCGALATGWHRSSAEPGGGAGSAGCTG